MTQPLAASMAANGSTDMAQFLPLSAKRIGTVCSPIIIRDIGKVIGYPWAMLPECANSSYVDKMECGVPTDELDK